MGFRHSDHRCIWAGKNMGLALEHPGVVWKYLAAWWETKWFQLPWPRDTDYTSMQCIRSIAQKELLPVVIACMLWGRFWKGQVIFAHCDNSAAVEVTNAGYSKDAFMMHLLRTLFFVKACWERDIRAEHIRGIYNGLADANVTK